MTLLPITITIEAQDVPTFFGQPKLPQPVIHPKLLTTQSVMDTIMTDNECFHVLKYMDLTMNTVLGEEGR